MIIHRIAFHQVEQALARQAAVALIGPRQVGKTTLALAIGDKTPSLYLDLEAKSDRDKLSDPELFLKSYEDKLVILDEIHRAPELFQTLRSLIDIGRRKGRRTGRFLMLGSASIDLLKQSGETLAGRIEYIDMGVLTLFETKNTESVMNRLWLRGGFPDSYLAASDEDSFRLRRNFIRTYLERDVPQFGFRVPAETLDRFWTMLAHNQGGLLNASRLASSLAVSAPTLTHYLNLLVDLLLIRRLAPYHNNIGKRLVKSPKVYVRDSGLVHSLLGIRDSLELSGHPVVGASWEGFVIENILAIAPEQTKASFYRTTAGAEIDLLLELGGHHGCWAIEIKRGLRTTPSRGFYQALKDINPAKAFILYSGQERYPINIEVEAISLPLLLQTLASLN